MKLDSIGELIAERELFVSNSEAKLVVRMGKPQLFPDTTTGAHFCPFQFIGIGTERVRYAGGADAFQAIQLCYQMIGIELAVLTRDHGLQFRWEADKEGGSGFPFPEAFRES